MGEITQQVANICFDCERACGGCSWSEYDKTTGGTRFKIPEGATAKPVFDMKGRLSTYHITDCPLFIRSSPRSGTTGALTDSENDLFLQDPDLYYKTYAIRRK